MTWAKRPSLESTRIPTDLSPHIIGIFSTSGNLPDAEQLWNVGKKVFYCFLPQVTGSTASSFHLDSSRSSSLFGDMFHKSCKKFFSRQGCSNDSDFALQILPRSSATSRGKANLLRRVYRLVSPDTATECSSEGSAPDTAIVWNYYRPVSVCNRRVYLNSDQLFRGVVLGLRGVYILLTEIAECEKFHSPRLVITLPTTLHSFIQSVHFLFLFIYFVNRNFWLSKYC